MKVTIASWDGKLEQQIEAIPTCFPHLVITPSLLNFKPLKIDEGRYNITHVQTGASLIYRVPSVDLARKIAGAFSGLPIQWGKITRKNMASYLKRNKQWEPMRNWIATVRHSF